MATDQIVMTLTVAEEVYVPILNSTATIDASLPTASAPSTEATATLSAADSITAISAASSTTATIDGTALVAILTETDA